MKNDKAAGLASNPSDKPIADADRIGLILKKRRQALRLSLTDVELAIKIRGKFLIALEAGDYSSLRHDVYSKGFVQAYANFLGLNDRVIVKQYLDERGGLKAQTSSSKSRSSKGSRGTFVITPRIVMAVVALLVVVAVSIYLAWQISTLAAPPMLSLSNPSADQVIIGDIVNITGRVTLGADVFINEAPVIIDARGNFSEKVALQNGVNTIRVLAKNRLGKSKTITRNILAKKPEPLIKDAAPAATISGVEVDVSAKKSAVAIKVRVDGKDVFDGTMLAGTTQTFSGNQSVVITTGNAGQTSLKITNQTVVDKKLDPLGSEGEIKRDLEFNADTVIQ